MAQLTTNHNISFLGTDDVQSIIENSPEGKNTKFLNAAHSLWFRFKNYEKAPPFALEVDGKVVSMIFATFNRDGYSNLYEIVTVQGEEGKGYAGKVWDEYIRYAVEEKRTDRLKISCTPSSVTWHNRNGLVFWAVDPTGSLRSDQKLYATREAQLEHREACIKSPSIALPHKEKVRDQLKRESLESHGFGPKKLAATQTAIDSVGEAWLRDALFETTSLEGFFS